MTEKMTLTDGSPVPPDGSHRELRPDGQQKGYVVLGDEERAKGWVKPYRYAYRHLRCGGTTTMGRKLSETYARDPRFYSGTFCANCGSHFSLDQFTWLPDGEPMDPDMQEEWASKADERQAAAKREVDERRQRRIAELNRELAELHAQGKRDEHG